MSAIGHEQTHPAVGSHVTKCGYKAKTLAATRRHVTRGEPGDQS